MPLLSLVALTRPSPQGRKRNVRPPPFRQLTAVSRPPSPTSGVTPKHARRRRMCLSTIPVSQYPPISLAAGNQRRSCLSRVFAKPGCPNEPAHAGKLIELGLALLRVEQRHGGIHHHLDEARAVMGERVFQRGRQFR